jgi:hypothetical protein
MEKLKMRVRVREREGDNENMKKVYFPHKRNAKTSVFAYFLQMAKKEKLIEEEQLKICLKISIIIDFLK